MREKAQMQQQQAMAGGDGGQVRCCAMGMHGAAFGLAFTISNVAAAAFGSWSIARKNESHCCKRAAQMVPFEPRGIPRGVGVHWGAKMARRPSGSPAGLAHSHTARAGTVRESMAAAEARWGPRGGRWRQVYVARCMTGGSDQAGAVGRVLLHRRPAHER